MLTLDTKRSLYDEGRGLQVPMVWSMKKNVGTHLFWAVSPTRIDHTDIKSGFFQ